MMAGWIVAALGAVGSVYSLITIQNDMNPRSLWEGAYTYSAPLTSHEITMIALAVVSVIALVAGIVMIVKSKKS